MSTINFEVLADVVFKKLGGLRKEQDDMVKLLKSDEPNSNVRDDATLNLVLITARIDILQEVADLAIIMHARNRLETEDGQADPSLSIFMVRDLAATDKAGFKDLMWALHREGYVNLREAKETLDDLLKSLGVYVKEDNHV